MLGFGWIDRLEKYAASGRPGSRLLNQLLPFVVCAVLLTVFILASIYFIEQIINPASSEKIIIHLLPMDVAVGFFLYFVTAVDYALIIGRMQSANTGLKARFVMNVFTCLGCFVGVSLVLFLWGFAKEFESLIIALLIFAGCVMVKLAYEGLEYFEHAKSIWKPIRLITAKVVTLLHDYTQALTFWIPELGSPKVKKMPLSQLALWSLFLPFVIGLDDFVGYMGAMTIYNVFSLLVGIYIADIAIDLLIFVSPRFTKKMVESAILSLLATFAFLYLMYKSFSEAVLVFLHAQSQSVSFKVAVVCLFAYLIGHRLHRHVFAKK